MLQQSYICPLCAYEQACFFKESITDYQIDKTPA